VGKVDQTLFLLRQGRDILILYVYVDDIFFGGSSNSLVARFAKDMSREFEMSMMGELPFFIGLQIKQSKEGTFVHQAKYTKDIVRKFKMEDSKTILTKVTHGICDPKELRATTSCGDILCLGSGLSNTRLFAGRPRHQKRSQELGSPRSGLPIQPTPSKIRI
jgi:hypothetical protein